MKKNIFIILSMIFVIYGHAESPTHGVWIGKDLYEFWKSGADDEVIVPMSITIDEREYIGFYHQTQISNEYLRAGDSGQWRIIFYEEKDNKITYHLNSMNDNALEGTITIVLVHENAIYFDTFCGDDMFVQEVRHSSLQFGEEYLYYRVISP